MPKRKALFSNCSIQSGCGVLGDGNFNVVGIECLEMTLGEPDESGRRRPVEKPGSEFVIDVDCVVLAIGTSPNPLIKSTTDGLETASWGGIIADEATGRQHPFPVYMPAEPTVTGAATVIFWPSAPAKPPPRPSISICRANNCINPFAAVSGSGYGRTFFPAQRRLKTERNA